MNTLGKILVVLVFIMSIFFMAFSFLVYMTHTNWEKKAAAAASEVAQATEVNRQLKADVAIIETSRAAENAARKSALAKLEGRARSAEDQLRAAETRLATIDSDKRKAQTLADGSIRQLVDESSKVKVLRESVKKAEALRDSMFNEVAALNDRLLQLEADRQRLEARERDLLDSLSRWKAQGRAHDINEFDDIANVAPPRDGRVSRIDGIGKFVALTLGSDDGIRPGHTMDVVRGDKYMGRVEVTKTYSDKAVAKILDNFRKGAIKVGDGIRTK